MDLLSRFNSGEQNFLAHPNSPPECDADSVPNEIKVSGGVCLVIGCHPCWEEDLTEALQVYPDAKICAVNYAAELVNADYIATVHGRSMPRFVRLHEKTWPGAKLPILIQRQSEEAMDGIHSIKVRTLATSGCFSAAAMVMLGYDMAILCGSPITGSGGYAQKTFFLNDWKVDETHNRIKCWHEGMRIFKNKYPEVGNKIRSMSGATKRIFGGLDDN